MSSLHRSESPVKSAPAVADRSAWTDADRGPESNRLPDGPIPPELEELLDPFGDHDRPALADLEWEAMIARADATAESPGIPLLPFADWIALKASLMHLDGTDSARWLAHKLDELAAMARRLQAQTPDQYDARLEVEDDARDARLRDEGYDDARRAATLRQLLF